MEERGENGCEREDRGERIGGRGEERGWSKKTMRRVRSVVKENCTIQYVLLKCTQ